MRDTITLDSDPRILDVREEVTRQLETSVLPVLNSMRTELENIRKELPDDKVSMVIFSNDMDKVLAAYTVALGALGMGATVSMYFTFWGLSAIKKGTRLSGKNFMQKMVNVMTPGKQEKLNLSKMNFGGMGPAMFKSMMKKQGVASLSEMRDLAIEMGATMMGCSMAMEVMGINGDEFIEGVEVGGVAAFLEKALKSKATLFF